MVTPRLLATVVLLSMGSCAQSSADPALEIRRAALQELLTRLEAPEYPYSAACVALDPATSVDGLHQPPDGFAGSLRSNRLDVRPFGACVENPGLPGFRWDTTAAARAEVLVGVTLADSVAESRAVVHVLWLADGGTGEDYRCVVVRGGEGWIVQGCERTGIT